MCCVSNSIVDRSYFASYSSYVWSFMITTLVEFLIKLARSSHLIFPAVHSSEALWQTSIISQSLTLSFHSCDEEFFFVVFQISTMLTSFLSAQLDWAVKKRSKWRIDLTEEESIALMTSLLRLLSTLQLQSKRVRSSLSF